MTLFFIDVFISLGGFVTKISQGIGNQAFFCISSLIAGEIDATHPIKRNVNGLKLKEKK